MMTGIIANAWKTVKPHIPLIKFRKGASLNKGHPGKVTTSATPAITKGGKPHSSSSQHPAIEDWQLPNRYRRQLIDEKEIDAINSGGAY